MNKQEIKTETTVCHGGKWGGGGGAVDLVRPTCSPISLNGTSCLPHMGREEGSMGRRVRLEQTLAEHINGVEMHVVLFPTTTPPPQ